MSKNLTNWGILATLLGVCVNGWVTMKNTASVERVNDAQLVLEKQQNEFNNLLNRKKLDVDRLKFVGQTIQTAFKPNLTENQQKAHLVTIELIMEPHEFEKFQKAIETQGTGIAKVARELENEKAKIITNEIETDGKKISSLLEQIRACSENDRDCRKNPFEQVKGYSRSPALVVALTKFLDSYSTNTDPDYVNKNARYLVFDVITSLQPSSLTSYENTLSLKNSLLKIRKLSGTVKHVSPFGRSTVALYETSIDILDERLR